MGSLPVFLNSLTKVSRSQNENETHHTQYISSTRTSCKFPPRLRARCKDVAKRCQKSRTDEYTVCEDSSQLPAVSPKTSMKPRPSLANNMLWLIKQFRPMQEFVIILEPLEERWREAIPSRITMKDSLSERLKGGGTFFGCCHRNAR